MSGWDNTKNKGSIEKLNMLMLQKIVNYFAENGSFSLSSSYCPVWGIVITLK